MLADRGAQLEAATSYSNIMRFIEKSAEAIVGKGNEVPKTRKGAGLTFPKG